MATATSEIKMGRPKRDRVAKTVRIDADLIGWAEMLAKDQGDTTIGEYLSAILRPILDQRWRKLIHKKAGGFGEK